MERAKVVARKSSGPEAKAVDAFPAIIHKSRDFFKSGPAREKYRS
jgi:hypothetical protein